ncbi:hypothetical protein ACFYOD_35940 [Streptomyces sp. NPDC006703]|uniref:hypothetical protein n=1 Tax=Streptomyces sp. NPDC006703 TaxID=3364759 RepID=UPI003675BC45
MLWQDWAAPAFGVTPDRLLAATHATQEHWQVEWAAQMRRWQEQYPERAAHIDRIAREFNEATAPEQLPE